MRTIGKKNKNLVIRLTIQELEKRNGPSGFYLNDYQIEQKVRSMLPASVWDTWEMSDSEINRIIGDTINSYGCRNRFKF